jgi:RNA polymerase sigma factor (sigma-70 family)
MNGHSLGAAVRRLREALGGPAGSDAALLDRFAADRDPAAFAGLVARYGPVVLGVCRRVVGDPHLAEDVFQAVFLVLARKAGSIRKRDAVGSWLYGVAFRLARKAASRERQRPESANSRTPVADAPGLPDPAATAAWNDLLTALDAELQRLPDRLRAPLLLCYFDGCTQDEAARRLGWTFGTLRRRLDQGRDLLRVRMTARGATLGAGLLATVLATRGARAAVPVILSRTTIDAACTFAVGGPLAGTAAQLAEEGLRMLGASKMRMSVAIIALAGGLAVGGGALFGVGRDQPGAKDQPPAVQAPGALDPTLPAGVVLRREGAPFRHGTDIINVVVTPDGKSILTQGARSVRIWDAASGHDQGVLALPDEGADFWMGSLTPDGKTLLTTRHNGTGQVWDIAARKLTRSFSLAAPPFDVTRARCAHSPDGKAIAIVTTDGSIRVCDVAAGKEMEQLRSHSDAVTAATFSPNGKNLILDCEGDRMLVWDVVTGVEDKTRVHSATHSMNLRFSANGKWLAAATTYKNSAEKAAPAITSILNLYDWDTLNPDVSLGGNSLADQLMIFSPDGRYLLAPDRRSGGRILTQWDLRTLRAVRQYPTHGNPIHALAFSADGKTLITADTGLRFWDWTTGAERRPASDDERCYALTADGKAFIEGSSTGVIRIWDSTTGKESHHFEVPRGPLDLRTYVTGVAGSPDGKYLAVQGYVARDQMTLAAGHYIWVWDMATAKLLHRLIDQPPGSALGSTMTFGPDGQTLISTSRGRPATIWDMVTGLVETESELKSGAQVAFSTAEKRRSVWDGNLRVFVRSLDDKAEYQIVPLGTQDGRAAPKMAFASDGSGFAVFGTPDRSGPACIRVFNAATGKFVRRFDNPSRPPNRLALSATSALLAMATDTENPSIQVFDVATGRDRKTLTGLHGQVAWLAFSADGKRLYAASTDTTVLAWELP